MSNPEGFCVSVGGPTILNGPLGSSHTTKALAIAAIANLRWVATKAMKSRKGFFRLECLHPWF